MFTKEKIAISCCDLKKHNWRCLLGTSSDIVYALDEATPYSLSLRLYPLQGSTIAYCITYADNQEQYSTACGTVELSLLPDENTSLSKLTQALILMFLCKLYKTVNQIPLIDYIKQIAHYFHFSFTHVENTFILTKMNYELIMRVNEQDVLTAILKSKEEILTVCEKANSAIILLELVLEEIRKRTQGK